MLPRCTTLTELFISYNEKIGSAGVRELREAEDGSALTVDVRKRLWTRPFGGGVGTLNDERRRVRCDLV